MCTFAGDRLPSCELANASQKDTVMQLIRNLLRLVKLLLWRIQAPIHKMAETEIALQAVPLFACELFWFFGKHLYAVHGTGLVKEWSTIRWHCITLCLSMTLHLRLHAGTALVSSVL